MNLQVRDDVIDLLSLDEYCTSSLMSPLPNNYEPPSTHAIQELMVGRLFWHFASGFFERPRRCQRVDLSLNEFYSLLRHRVCSIDSHTRPSSFSAGATVEDMSH